VFEAAAPATVDASYPA